MGGEEFWAAVGTPLTLFIVALLVYLTKKIEGKVKNAVKNGTVQKAIGETVKQAIETEIQPRLDKIEAGTFSNMTRLETLEEHVAGGKGQHFRPPTAMVDPSAGAIEARAKGEEEVSPEPEHTVIGTQPQGDN